MICFRLAELSRRGFERRRDQRSSLEASEYGFIRLPQDKPADLTLDYRIELASHADQWHLNFDDAMNDAQIDELDVVIRLPQELEFRTDFYNSRTYDDLDKVTLEVSEDGRLLHLYSTAGLSGDDRVSVEIDIPRGAQQRMAGGQTGFWTMFGVGTLLAAGLFWLMNRHSKRRTVGELPNGINPLQAALLTGKPVSAKTLASVIVNWAARDYIEIQREGQTIRLTRKRSLIHQPEWEKQFLRSLLALGDGNTVTLDEIRRDSASCVRQACRQARVEKTQWQHKGLTGLRWLLIGLSVLPPVMITGVLLRQTSLEGIVILLSLGLIAVTIALGSMTAAVAQGTEKVPLAAADSWVCLADSAGERSGLLCTAGISVGCRLCLSVDHAADLMAADTAESGRAAVKAAGSNGART